MSVKPWYLVVSPREDIRENKSVDMAEFAPHLDHIRPEQMPPGLNKITREGEIPYRDWQRFYKVFAKFGECSNVKIRVNVEADSESGFSKIQVEEIKFTLSESGLSNDIKTE